MRDLLARARGRTAQQGARAARQPAQAGRVVDAALAQQRAAAARRARRKRLVTRQLARAADDGYRNPLVPGLRATADAERLAGALTAGRARLEPPGPYPVIAEIADLEQATWLAFLLALAPGTART